MRLRLVVLSLVAAVAVAFAGIAGAVERLAWEDLSPPLDSSADPLMQLPYDLQTDYFDLMWARSLIAEVTTVEQSHSATGTLGASAEETAAELEATEAEARANLEAAGVDVEALIAESEAFLEVLEANNATLVDALDGRDVALPGYVLPLEYTGTEVSEFLLVPYVGACIHVPPPPLNQIVHVRFGDGFESTGLFTPVLVSGRISAGHSSQSLSYVDGSADIAVGYSLEATEVALYNQ